MSEKTRMKAGLVLIGAGLVFGGWALAVMLGGLYRTGWNVTEFIRSGLVASGLVQPIHTMVDFYTHIKGVEYIICVGFFVVFPIFYRYVDKPERTLRVVEQKPEESNDFPG